MRRPNPSECGCTRLEDTSNTSTSARRSGFSQPTGMTAVPSSMREVRWVAAASTATGEEMPYKAWD